VKSVSFIRLAFSAGKVRAYQRLIEFMEESALTFFQRNDILILNFSGFVSVLWSLNSKRKKANKWV
jgi:hypothetical protein